MYYESLKVYLILFLAARPPALPCLYANIAARHRYFTSECILPSARVSPRLPRRYNFSPSVRAELARGALHRIDSA